MTTLDDLVQLFEQEPHNPIVTAMLTDELMESRGMNRSEADLAVFRAIPAAAQALMLRQGVQLLKADSPSRNYLIKWVLQKAQIPRGESPVVLVDTGITIHVRTPHGPVLPDRYWGHVVILVGATLLIRTWDERVAAVRSARRARYRARKVS